MLIFLVGFLAIVSQIVLLRELNVAFYGVELVYALALAAWMLGGAAGSLVRWRGGARGTALLLGSAAALLPATVALIRTSRPALGGIPGAYLPFADQLLVLGLATLPQSAILGLAFRSAAVLAADAGGTLAGSYAIESAGACVGAAAATVSFLAGVQTFTVAVVAAGAVPTLLVVRAAAGQASNLSLRTGATQGPRSALRTGWKPVLLTVVTMACAWFAPRLDLGMTRWTHPAVVLSRDSPYARITVSRSGSQTALFMDDVLVHESESSLQEELAHVAGLAHPEPRDVLVLGGHASGIDRELSRHGAVSVVSVESDRLLVSVLQRFFAASNDVVVADPRRSLDRGPFDVIVNAMPQPSSGQTNRFYTREFFEECRARLRPGGLLAFRLDLPENAVSPLILMRSASVTEAARQVFPAVESLRGNSVIVLASLVPLPIDASPLIARWRTRGLETRLVRPSYLQYLWDRDRRLELRTRLQSVTPRANTDTVPICYQVTAIGWLAKFFPSLLAVRTQPDLATVVGLGLVVLAAFVLVGRRSTSAAGTGQALLAGFAGMLLETVLLLAYQAHSGALYEHIGLLLLAFMMGLAAGAAAVDRMRSRHRPMTIPRAVTAGLALALALAGALVALVISAGALVGLWGTAALMLISGGVTAAIFATLGSRPSLYAADLTGGAFGSLLAGLLFVPSLGLAATAWVVCGAGLTSVALAVTGGLQRGNPVDTPLA
jgi:spermidine synthase